MALTVEDGTIVSGADSYGSEAGFAAYATSMNWTLGGDATSQEADMRRAAAYLDRTYKWIGIRSDAAQNMQWPRYYEELVEGYPLDSSTIPDAIVTAQYEIAWIFNQGNDLFAYDTTAAVKRLREKVGQIEVETEYATDSSVESRLLSVEGLLRPYITGGSPGSTFGQVTVLRS